MSTKDPAEKVKNFGSDNDRDNGLPVWLLTPKEEKDVYNNWREHTWQHCDEYVREFSKCEQQAGLGVWFKCRKQSKAMRQCIERRKDKKYVDAERDAYIDAKMKRRGFTTKEAEEKELRKELLTAADRQ